MALNPYTTVDNGTLIDQKFGVEYSLLNKIYVYDSNANLVKEIYVEDMPQLMLDQPKLIRHWVQLFKDTWIQDNDGSKVAIVVQGPVIIKNDFTFETLKLYVNIFPNEIIVLSTWDCNKNVEVFAKIRNLGVHIVPQQIKTTI